MLKRFKNIFILIIISQFGCGPESEVEPSNRIPYKNSSDWLVEDDRFLFDGGVGKDGIASLTYPNFTKAELANYLNNDDIVLVVKSGDRVKAYPHRILDWHEIINDSINGEFLAINYCPLTGTGHSWNREINNTVTTFGVSGLLYNSNIVPYDRETDSYWSQIDLISIRGQRRGEEPSLMHSIEMSWGTAKLFYPNIEVVSENTGFEVPYHIYPYTTSRGGDYREVDVVYYPVLREDCSRFSKERLYGIITDESAVLYSFSNFQNGFTVMNESIRGESFLLVGDAEQNFISAFESVSPDGIDLIFEKVKDSWPVVMKDQLENQYSLFGEVLEGTNKGYVLKNAKGFIGYWFSWVAFYDNIRVVDLKPPVSKGNCD